MFSPPLARREAGTSWVHRAPQAWLFAPSDCRFPWRKRGLSKRRCQTQLRKQLGSIQPHTLSQVVDSLPRRYSLLIAGAMGPLLAACSVSTAPPPPDLSSTTTKATTSIAVASSTPSDAGVVPKLCPLPPALGPALDSSWRRKAPGDGYVFAGSGRSVNDIPVILLHEDNQRVGLVDLETGEIKRVLARYPDISGVLGRYEGDDVAWRVFTSPTDLNAYEIWMWHQGDSAPRRLDTSKSDGSGAAYSVPWDPPLVHAGKVIWVRANTVLKTYELVAFDVATKRETVIVRGNPGTPVLVGNDLFWEEPAAPGSSAHRLKAARFGTWEPVTLPDWAGVDVPPMPMSDGVSLAWLKDATSILMADHLKAPPRVIYPVKEGQGFNPPFNWRDGIISGLSTKGQLILDTQSLRYLLIPETGSGGWSPRGLELMRYSSSDGDASKALSLSELRQLLACP